jgi:hypothetical protein
MTRTQVAWLTAVAVLAVAAFFSGRALHPEASSASAFDLDADAYQASSAIAGLSKAGFSGFTEGGAEGRTVISGRVISVAPDSITVEGRGGERSTLRLSGQGQPRRLAAASKDAIRPGVTVIVKREPGSDIAKAVLVISN